MQPTEFGILSPAALTTILLVVVVAVLEWRSSKGGQAMRILFGLPQVRSNSLRRSVTLSLILILIASVSRPYWGSEEIETESSGSDILFLVDISRSMYAQDVPPSRIELAKRKMKDLVQSFSLTGAGARFGITVFAGDGYTVCPVTTDRGVLAQFIDVISPDLVTSLGSNLNAGLHAALARLDDVSRRSSRIILISDGEDNILDQAAIIAEVREKGVRVDVIGVGTTAGSSIVLPNGSTVVDGSRRPVTSALSEGPLRALADASGGIYIRATLDDSDVQALSETTISPASSYSQKTEIRTYREIGPWLALAALVVLMCAAISRRANPLLIVPLFILLARPTSLSAQTPPSPKAQAPRLTRSPFESYQRGDYTKAIEEYSQALKNAPADRSLLFGLGSSLYRLGRHQESADTFRKLADTAPTGRDFFESKYNEANALLSLGRFSDAIDAYWRALDVKPEDPAASQNLSIARALLEAQQHATPTPTPTPTPEPSQPPQPSPDPEESPSPDSSPSPNNNFDDQTEATPSPSADSSQAPPAGTKDSATPAESPAPSQSQTPTADPSSSGDTAPPTASPHAEPNRNSQASDTPPPSERLKESRAPEAEQSPAAHSSPAAEITAAMPEADAWLESLPDSPLLIRKYRGTPSVGGQTW
jgi:Ca-activated chloride channel family protein